MSITAMIIHLEDLLEIHRLLLEITERKRGAIVDNEVDILTGYVNQESRLIKQVTQKDDLWKNEALTFVAALGLKTNKTYTITEIMALVDNETERERLRRVQSGLLDVIAQIKKNNAVNEQLIKQSLAYIDYSLDLYTGSFAQESVYENPTQAKKPDSRSKGAARFDTRA